MTGGIEKRVYMHYKALKRTHNKEFVVTGRCGWMNNCGPGTEWVLFPHSHGYYKLVTSNSDWLLLARTHKMPVRQVKDIVTRMRAEHQNGSK